HRRGQNLGPFLRTVRRGMQALRIPIGMGEAVERQARLGDGRRPLTNTPSKVGNSAVRVGFKPFVISEPTNVIDSMNRQKRQNRSNRRSRVQSGYNFIISDRLQSAVRMAFSGSSRFAPPATG